jgi:MFS family permease
MQIPEKKIKKALNNSIKEGAAFSTMDGITSTYSTPFALSMGASNSEIGILNSLPSLLMSIAQALSGGFIYKRGRKEIAVKFGLLHKLIWIPIILMPILFANNLWLFIILFSVSGTVISLANTSWSCWMGGLVPEKIRGIYFGKRNTIQSAFSFLATIAAGYLLGFLNGPLGFSLVFFLAFSSGMVSYFYLNRIPPEAKEKHEREHRHINIIGFIGDFKKYRNFFPFTVHMSLMNFAVNLSSPFFTVYMLSVMNVGYEWYAIIVGGEVLTRIFMMRHWGKLSDRYGDRNIMTICNVLIVFYPILFLFCRNPIELMLVGVFSGFAWSGFDLTTFNYLLDVTPSDKRPTYIANYKVAIGMALFLGPFVGGYLSQYFSTVAFQGLDGLQTLFILSFILRFVFTAYGLPKLKEVRARRTMPITDVFLRAFATYPMKGITHDLTYVHNRFDAGGRRFGVSGRRLGRKVKKTLKEIYLPQHSSSPDYL